MSAATRKAIGGGGAGDTSDGVDEAHRGSSNGCGEEFAGDDGETTEIAGAEEADDGADDE
jgi:hypothetical protein